MPAEPRAPRHTSEDLGDRLIISFPSPRQWWSLLFWGFIIVFWTCIAGSGYWLDLPNQKIKWGDAILWLGFLAAGPFYAIYAVLWQLLGSEQIEVLKDSIIITRHLLGLSSRKGYSGVDIRHLRMSSTYDPDNAVSPGESPPLHVLLGYGAGTIIFDYQGKTVRMGTGIQEVEAKQVIAEIQQKYPQYRKQAS